MWDHPPDDTAHLDWARALWSALQSFSTGGVYANNLGDEGEDRVRAAFGGNYSPLAEVKRQYDPAISSEAARMCGRTGAGI